MEFLLLFVPLFFIAYEDFKHRAIHWIWLVVMTVGVLCCFSFNGKDLGVNLLLMAIQLTVLTIYFSLKERQLVFLPKRHLGWGDILFYLPLCLMFSPVDLILFLTIGFLLVLMAFGLYNALSKHPVHHIPLAGCLSVLLIGLLVLDHQQGSDFYSRQLLSSVFGDAFQQ